MIFATPIRRTIHIKLALVVVLGLMLGSPVGADSLASSLLIYQLQTGAPSSASQEYIAIYNNTNQPVEVTNWCITYASSSDVTQSQLGCLKPTSSTSKLYLPAHQSFLLATSEFVQAHVGFTPDIVFTPGIAGTSGHIKLLDSTKNLVDAVGWGTAVHPEGSAVIAPVAGKILQRHSTSNVLQDLGNNATDFYQTDLSLPLGGSTYEESVQLIDSPMPILSEIMPDAAGADAGKEFIELYNPNNTAIDLSGYALALGPSFTKLYSLPGVILQPQSYLSFSDTETGVTLPNTSATVRLISPNTTTASEVSYTDLEEDTSLAYIDTSWQVTYQPTPGSTNIAVTTKPCPEGEVRSSESGQCKTVSLAASVLPCKADQTRNLETGRCKNIATAATTSAACKIGQEKNPETNRCRTIVVPAAAKPCPAGQERNTETGRCRKITDLAATGTNSVKDVPSALVTNNVKWWIAGAAVVGTIGYGLYEWRHEVFNLSANLKSKLAPS